MALAIPLNEVSTKYGAPMGRGKRGLNLEGAIAVSHGRPFADKVALRRVRLNSGGYDSGGAYWGTGPRLYWAGDDTAQVDMWFRSPTRAAAKAHVLASFPNATFYR